MICRHWIGRLVLPLAACLFGGAVYAGGPFLWAVGLSPAESPQELPPEHRPMAAPEAWVMAEGGDVLALVAKGQPIPSSLSRHHPLLVTLAGPSPEVVADVPLQWRPDGVPNLPPPFGRVTTGKGGTVTLYPPQAHLLQLCGFSTGNFCASAWKCWMVFFERLKT